MSTLHITNGDHVADKLRRVVRGTVAITADILHEGPAPAVDGDAWYETRARYLASAEYSTFEEARAGLAAWDRAIETSDQQDDIVLWFEHDLFDQLLLIRTLDLIGGSNRTRATPTAALRHGRVSLICVGAFPGVERFVSLSQLTEAQLAKLDGTGDAVTTELCAAATDAWNAFRAPDPTQILRHLTRIPNLYPLRFLGGALKRFVEEFPSLANGLSRTESLVLHLLSEGPMHGGALFVSSQDHEMRPFMGDAAFYRVLHRLASARVPLVTIDAAADQLDLRQREVTVTDSGLQVLAGLADHVALNGLDLWRGGVHLIGSDRSPWRWDTRGERLVS